ncbi:hypothetical protein CYMTET_34039 [Cymbomonas tetramitiformis]|uniref:Uncharacterized protein n=1 Tax=Cymbomonas tetramitiformis TaxID=36881 RepID=A0AAE0FCH0_9CHLO|nr:hypothetical protein CYMTET_34039 [Cymbomonas tetramitiformis]
MEARSHRGCKDWRGAGFVEDTEVSKVFKKAMQKNTHKRPRSGEVFMLVRDKHPKFKKDEQAEKQRKFGRSVGTTPETAVYDAAGVYTYTRPVEEYKGDPYYEKLRSMHPSRTHASLKDIHDEELKSQEKGKAPAGYSPSTWKQFQKMQHVVDKKWERQADAVTQLEGIVKEKKKAKKAVKEETKGGGIEHAMKHEKEHKEDLVRLEAEAASVTAVIERRRAEIASRQSFVRSQNNNRKSAQVSNDIGRLTAAVEKLETEHKALQAEIIHRRAEHANAQSLAVQQFRSQKARVSKQDQLFQAAKERIKAQKMSDIKQFKRPVKTWDTEDPNAPSQYGYQLDKLV